MVALKQDKKSNILFWMIFFIVFCYTIFLLKSVLMPFVAGIVIAYFLDPVADRLQKWGCSRNIAVTIITLLLVLILFPAMLMLLQAINSQILSLVTVIPEYTSTAMDKITPFLENLRDKIPSDKYDELLGVAKTGLVKGFGFVTTMIGNVITSGVAVLNVISLLVITPIVAFYMIRDWDKMLSSIDNFLPRGNVKVIREQAREINKILASFIRGQALVCMILGAFYSIGLTLLGLEFGLVIGFMAGVISFIPYVGSLVGFVVSIGLAIAQFGEWNQVLYVALVFFFGQFVEGNFLTPRLVGGSVGLHPVWVMFALLAGGTLLGFLGVLIAVPVAAVVGVLVRFALTNYKQSKMYLNK